MPFIKLHYENHEIISLMVFFFSVRRASTCTTVRSAVWMTQSQMRTIIAKETDANGVLSFKMCDSQAEGVSHQCLCGYLCVACEMVFNKRQAIETETIFTHISIDPWSIQFEMLNLFTIFRYELVNWIVRNKVVFFVVCVFTRSLTRVQRSVLCTENVNFSKNLTTQFPAASKLRQTCDSIYHKNGASLSFIKESKKQRPATAQ